MSGEDRRISREWRSANAQVVLMRTRAGYSMHREKCPDHQFWMLIEGAWLEQMANRHRRLSVSEHTHYHPLQQCARKSITDTLSLGIRVFDQNQLQSDAPDGLTKSPKRALWRIATLFASGESREDVLDEAVVHLVSDGSRPEAGNCPRWLERVREALHSEATPTSLADLAIIASVTPTHLSATFTKYFGVPVSRYRMELRLQRAVAHLGDGSMPTGEAALASGFYDQAHLGHVCREYLDLTPRQLTKVFEALKS